MEADSAGPDRPFNCDFCPKKYLRKNNLEDHILMEHPDTDQVTQDITVLPQYLKMVLIVFLRFMGHSYARACSRTKIVF